MLRFGLVRLVELTMDWHFNSVDIENIDVENYGKQIAASNKKLKLRNSLYRADDHELNIHSAGVSVHSSGVSSGAGTVTALTHTLNLPTNYLTDSYNVVSVGTNTVNIGGVI
jgi:hypothetical protein